MGAYKLLWRITIEHMYFGDLACKSLEFFPIKATTRLLNKSGLLLKATDNRLSVFYEDDRLDILRMHAEDDFEFSFKIFSKDANFLRYTLPGIQAQKTQNAILFFDNKRITKDNDGRQLLHNRLSVSDEDYVDLSNDLVKHCLESRDYHVRPCFIVKLSFRKNARILSLNPQNDKLRQFYISFATNKTFWKYYLMGDLSGRNLHITDLDNEIVFEEIGSTVLPGNRLAKMLQSTRAIPMQEKPTLRLQLKESLALRDKVLINRLPNASINQINGEKINGKMENVSEIYVH